MKRILCIWIPRWPLQRLAATRPEPEEGSREQGAGSGETRRRGDADDREALVELAAWCQRFSPVVGVEDSPTPECLFLDITGLDHLFGGETRLAEKIVKDFSDRGLVVRVAIADTLGAAWAVARFGDCIDILVPTLHVGTHGPAALRPVQETTQSVSNVRSHAERGNEKICNLPPGQSSLALKPLPIEALRLPPETVELLHSLGIVRIEQLELLPREELSCRFGPRLAQRLDQAAGRLVEPIPVQLPPPKFAARHELEYPIASRETVALILEQLVSRVAEMLAGNGRGAVQLECRLDCQSGEPVPVSVGLFQPTAAPRHLSQLILVHLERASIPSPIIAISVEAPLTGPLDHRQEELFADGRVSSRPRLLAILIDRLASRLGRRSVLRARLMPEAQPELAYQYDSLISARRAKNAVGWPVGRPFQAVSSGLERPSYTKSASHRAPRRTPGMPLDRELPPRPLRLLRQPIVISVISAIPDGPPFCFRLRDREHRIAWIWGPERIETGWWRGRAIARDYYRVETATGQRFWLFRNLEEGRWFLHGNFE